MHPLALPAYTLVTVMALALMLRTSEPAHAQDSIRSAEPTVQRVGPPTVYSPSVERYRFGAYGPGLISDPAFYPIPQDPVTRDTYLRWLEEMDLAKLADTPRQGLWGPQQFMPVLVKYVQTGKRRYGEAIVAMLKDWHRATLDEIWQIDIPDMLAGTEPFILQLDLADYHRVLRRNNNKIDLVNKDFAIWMKGTFKFTVDDIMFVHDPAVPEFNPDAQPAAAQLNRASSPEPEKNTTAVPQDDWTTNIRRKQNDNQK